MLFKTLKFQFFLLFLKEFQKYFGIAPFDLDLF
jgi:hypothetical protein